MAGFRNKTSKQRQMTPKVAKRRKPSDRKVSRRTVLKGGGAAIAAGVGHLVPGPVSDLLGGSSSAAASTSFGGYLPQLRRYPYLTDVVSSYATINWATDRSQTKASVIWGQEAGDGTFVLDQVTTATRVSITVNSVPVYQWKAELAGLAPDTVYRYRVILGTNPGIDLLGTDVSPAFRSQIAAGDGQPFTFAVFGDWASVYEADGTHPAQANLMAQVLAANPRFAVTTGDNGNHSGSQNNYGDLYTVGAQISGTFGPDFWARPGASIPIFPTIGNHGFGSGASHHPHLLNWPQGRAVSQSGGRYARAMYCCLNGTNAVEYPQTWYAFTAGNVRFYLLQTVWQDSNSGTADAYKNDYDYHWTQESEQYNWVKNDLEQHPHLLKLAFFHYPMYSDGKPIADVYLRGADSLEGLLASHGVAIAFNGHTHMYQRNLKPHEQGLVSYVTGGGGARLGPIGSSGCGVTTAYALGWSYSSNNGAGKGSACGAARPNSPDEVHHFLLVSVNGRTVTVTPINSLGQTFDVVTYDFSDISPVDIEAPTAPANLVANVQGPYSVDLTWEASSDNVGVTGYRVYRDDLELATVSGDTLQYLDETTAPESTYSYVVCAFDAAGNESEPGDAAVAVTPVDDQPPPPPVILFTDGFETGDMAMWTTVNGFAVQGQFVHSGFYAAVANVTNATAVAYRQLDQPYPELYHRIRFYVSAYASNTTYLQQFRTAQGGSLLGLYISGSGRLGYRNVVAGRNVASSTYISTGEWHEAQIRVRINGTASETEVWYDGNRVDQMSLTESLGSVDIGRIQLGESAARTHLIAFDDVVVSNGFIDPSVEPDPPPYVLDILPPTPPSDLVATATGVTGIDLSWSASFDNVGVTTYRIYRDAAIIAEVSGAVATWFDAGVLPDIAYTYTLDAQDAAGNVSELSAPVVATMLFEEPPPDEPPPDEPPPAATIFSDGFETGDMSLWTTSSGFTVGQANAHSGVHSAHLAITNAAGVAYRQLEQPYDELFHRIFFYMLAYDPKTTYLQQFRTLDGASLIGLYISASGRLGYRNIVSGNNTTSSINITPGVWHEAQFRVRIAGAESETEVWYDGVRVAVLSKTEPLGNDGIGRIQLGESAARTLDIAYDDVIVSTVFVDG